MYNVETNFANLLFRIQKKYYIITNKSKARCCRANRSVHSLLPMEHVADGKYKSGSLRIEDVNPNVREMSYPIRGPLTARAVALEEELKHGIEKPFTSIIQANVGCCHGSKQIPVTYARQLLATITYPSFLESTYIPDDIKQKARSFLEAVPGGSIGSYSATNGIPIVRQEAAKYIEDRDGIESNWKNIYLTNGASSAIYNLISLLNNPKNGGKVGVLTPVPEYPLYTSILSALGMEAVDYYLDEDKQWEINIDELESIMNSPKSKCTIKAIVVINPGNPTGQVLSRRNLEQIVEFSNNHGLMLIADEVYQQNIYNESKQFHSFKKVINDMKLCPNNISLASLMSASKGYLGECGLRGGYVEIVNMDEQVQQVFEKTLLLGLCPNTYGQAALYCLFKKPKQEDESYELFIKDKITIHQALQEKAKLATDSFNAMEGFSCTSIDGALYAFAKINLPAKVIQVAKRNNEEPDHLYARELLEDSGISLVPGSGFGQKPGTYHVRITILPQTHILKELFERLKNFHQKFLTKYS